MAPTGGGEGRGHTVAASHLQLVTSVVMDIVCVCSLEQNRRRLKLMLAAFDKHNRLMAEAQDNHGTAFRL